MVMSYMPFVAPLDDEHGEARGSGRGFAIHHSGKDVKAGNHYGVVRPDIDP
jgi:hypothetical protein